jgi:ferric-dicitrate binding protein FerR (iron transport regulator)
MSHLEHDTLWSLAKNELDEAAVASTQTHLAGCAECRVALEDVRLAQTVLFDLPPVPAMPEVMARRIGVQLAEAADARVAKSFISWWQALFAPRFLMAAAVAVTLVVLAAYLFAQETNGSTQPPAPIAKAPEALVVNPTVAPPKPLQKKLAVTVASAKKASAVKKQVLQEGAVVATQSGGSVWMQLPDGSRAGLTSATEVKLVTLESAHLALDIEKGSLALVVPHKEDRLLTVRAGDLVVKDLGTRFLVSREPTHTVVAVEEGVVEVNTPAGAKVVKAGHAVTWRDGKLTELDWEPTPPAQPKPVVVAQPEPGSDAQVKSIARLDEDDEVDETPPIDEAQLTPTSPPAEPTQPVAETPPDLRPVAADEQWAAMPKNTTPPAPAPVRKSKPPREGFSLRNLERKLREIGTVITSPTGREARAKNIMLAADAGDCTYALRLADEWMAEPVTSAATEASMKRGVQLQQVRCLNHVGRKDEAAALKKQVDAQK